MEEFKCLQPLEQMTRVSRVELGNQLDEILEIVDKNNLGYIITDDGKDDLVLCPARWFSCMYDNDFGSIKFQIDTALYNEAGIIFKQYGLTHGEAILLFIKETVRLGRIPFEYVSADLSEAKRPSGEVEIIGE